MSKKFLTNIAVTGTVSGTRLLSTQSLTNEGGEIVLSLPSSGSTLNTSVTIDLYNDRLRFFETGGTSKGFYIDLSAGTANAGTNLVGGGSASNSFATISTPAGTSPVADSSTDTLSFTTDSYLTITGDSTTDSIAFATGATSTNTASKIVARDANGDFSARVVTGDNFVATNNGNGTNFKVGDDAWIGDINTANTIRVTGIQDATQGYIVFGNSNATALGRSGTGALTYGGNTVWHAGNDGANSGLDADTLDTKHAADFGLVSGTLAQFASTTSAQLAGVISDETGSGALVFGTSPTISSPTISGLYLSDSSIVFEGSTADGFETTLTVTDPTADRTITIPNVDGTVITTGNLSSITTTGTITSGTWNATAITSQYGGTGMSGANPFTQFGVPYASSTSALTLLAPNTANGKRFFTQTGNGTASAAPAWSTIADGDLPSALTGKTYNALTLTAASTGFTIAGGTTSKTLTVSNTLTLTGTDGSTLNIGGGGNLGTAAFTASTAYATASHTHGNITNAGAIGSTADLIVKTTTSGVLTTLAAGTTSQYLRGDGVWATISAMTNPMTTTGDIIYSNSGTGTPARLAIGTEGQALVVNTGATAPSWTTLTLENLPGAFTKKAARVATTAAIPGTVTYANGTSGVGATLTLGTALTTIDGVTLANGDRILVKDQASAFQNGIYTRTSSTVLTRAVDADTNGEIASAIVAIDEGTSNGGKLFTNYFKATDTIGTTSMPWYAVLDSSTATISSTMTTNGDMVYRDTVPVRLPVGTEGQVLTVSSANLPSWQTPVFKGIVDVATTGNITLTDGSTPTTVDGITIANGDYILVKNQTTASQNGIYECQSSGARVWTRLASVNTSADVAGSVVAVDRGTANGGTTWKTTFKSTDTLGTTAMNWYRILDESDYQMDQGNGSVTFSAQTALTATVTFTAGRFTAAPAASAATTTNVRAARLCTYSVLSISASGFTLAIDSPASISQAVSFRWLALRAPSTSTTV